MESLKIIDKYHLIGLIKRELRLGFWPWQHLVKTGTNGYLGANASVASGMGAKALGGPCTMEKVGQYTLLN